MPAAMLSDVLYQGGGLLSTFSGFAPNWLEGQQNAGLGIYVSPGTIDGKLYNGNIVFVPANSATRVWITSKGLLQTGITVPDGTFGIALVTSGQVTTSGNTIGKNEVEEDGILNIEDIRTGI